MDEGLDFGPIPIVLLPILSLHSLRNMTIGPDFIEPNTYSI